jgi:hypothetical protein
MAEDLSQKLESSEWNEYAKVSPDKAFSHFGHSINVLKAVAQRRCDDSCRKVISHSFAASNTTWYGLGRFLPTAVNIIRESNADSAEHQPLFEKEDDYAIEKVNGHFASIPFRIARNCSFAGEAHCE